MTTPLVLANSQAPGDVMMLTAAVRDLHRCYPGQFITGVDTSAMELWHNNPYVTKDVQGQRLQLGYPLIHSSNQCGLHFIQGFISTLNKELKLKIRLTEFRPDLYLSPEEDSKRPIAEDYWLILSGGKTDFTTKWWDAQRYQHVVDQLKGEVQFVQIGAKTDAAMNHVHPRLIGVTDMLGKTTMREALTLLRHANGIVCSVTCFMHAAAAFNKPAVVVAGGREHYTWAAYTQETLQRNMAYASGILRYLPGEPHEWQSWQPQNDSGYVPHPFTPHTFLHSIGTLSCSMEGGCWRTRVTEGNREQNCINIVRRVGRQPLPRCMDNITVDDVVAAVRSHEAARKGVVA